jgi:hypothetical protein
MRKLGILASIATIVGAITIASFTNASATGSGDDKAGPAAPCQRKDFKTKMVKEACEKGGQPAAKDAMKAFNKEKKITSCNKCHDKLAPTYTLKADGLEQFKKLGGEVLDAGAAKPAK